MRIQGICRQNNGCDYYRVVLPLIYLQKDIEWNKTNQASILWISSQENLIDCDILIYNKLIGTPVTQLKALQAKGMKIIVDIDDMWVLPSGHAHYSQWNGSGNDKLTAEHIQMADVVTCTSIRLQEIIRPLNKNTIVIPNALPFGQGMYQPSIREPHDKVAFLYAGGVSHLPDVQLLAGKFKRIGTLPEIRNNAEFILAGYEQATRKLYATPEDLKAQNDKFTIQGVHGPYDHMATIFKATGSAKVLPTQHVTRYMQHYDIADVSLVPLMNNTWNSMKSELKLLEAGCRKLPCIVSNVPPYSDVVEFKNEGCMLVDEPDDWIRYIKHCIKNRNYITDAGEKLHDWTSAKYNLKDWNEVRKQLFNTLMK